MKKSRSFLFIVLPIFGISILFQNCDGMTAKFDRAAGSSLLSSQEALESDRFQDLEDLLRGIVDEERNERIAADTQLSNRIDKLEKEIAANNLEIDQQLEEIKFEQQSTREEIEQLNAQMENRIETLNVIFNNFSQEIGINFDEVKNLITIKTRESSEEIKSRIDQAVVKIENSIAENGLQDNQQYKELLAQVTSTKQELLGMKQSHQELVSYLNSNFVTKNEFSYLQGVFQDLKELVKNLDMKIDLSQSEIEKRMGDNIDSFNTRLEGLNEKIMDLELKDQELSKKIAELITDYKKEVEDLGRDLSENIQDMKNQILLITENKDTGLKQELVSKIKESTVQHTLMVKIVSSQLATKIRTLEDQLSEKADDAMTIALQQEMNEAKQEIAKMIEQEQLERERLQDQVDQLARDVSQVKADIATVRAIAQANQIEIRQINENFAEQKIAIANKFDILETDIDQKLAELKSDFEEKLKNVMSQAKELVADLGPDIQAQLAKVVADIATLKSQQANQKQELIQLAETFENNRAKIIRLEAELDRLSDEVVSKLTIVIKNYLAVQQQMMMILNPNDQDLKPYDEDFKQHMAHCGGDSSLSFPNAMGMESFQFLNLEFLRLLLTGVRTGTERDKIFHSFGTAFDAPGMQRTMILALVQRTYGESNVECADKISTWARDQILESDDFNEARKAISESSEMAAAIEELYRSINSLKPSVTDLGTAITEMTEDTDTGLQGEATDNPTQQAMVHYCLKFINFAMVQININSFTNNFSNMTVINNLVTENSADLNSKLEALKKSLDEFQTSTNDRIAKLENRVGDLEMSMEKVLNILNVLVDRSGHAEVKEYLLKVIVDFNINIDLDPITIARCEEPRVTMVQHYFTGEQAKRKQTSACSGGEDTAMRSLQDLNVNKLRDCWVNFRKIPKSVWGNEMKHVWLRIHGQMTKARVSCQQFDEVIDFRASSDRIKVYGNFKKGIFDVHMPTMLSSKTNRSSCRVTPICDYSVDDSIAGRTEQKGFLVFSPLALDFKTTGIPNLTSSDKGTLFDIDADGKLDQVAWLNSNTAGLLAFDRNKNGRIDDGSELFGEATFKEKLNGFLSLGTFDKNKDGIINSEDEIYQHLVLWFDYNRDGVTDKLELVPISDRNVTRIELNYKTNNPDVALVGDSEVRYSSKFYGPKLCSKQGCQVHDIYFGKQELTGWVAKK